MISSYVFYYPLIMSVIWMIGGTFFYYKYERKQALPSMEDYPFVSILVPCHNEAGVIESTIRHLLTLDYPAYELIVVDDGSTDGTKDLLTELLRELPIRVVLLECNAGKPTALNTGVLSCNGQIIVTIDADAVLAPDALKHLIKHFVLYPRVGAVTANPRVRNRTTLLGKIQTAEYSSIIGLIKRTQRILGKIMTVSGVATAFRLRALVDVGLWDRDMITDDINMTWKLEKKFWDIRYEPRALCWMLAPESFDGLWRQRKRWAQGGIEVLRRHRDVWLSWKCRRLWPVYLEQVFSVLWAVSFITLTLSWLATQALGGFRGSFPALQWHGMFLSLVCLLQFFVSMQLETKYDVSLLKYYTWVVWYPLVYWPLNAIAVVWVLPKSILRKMGDEATWHSPDRGLMVKP